MFRLPEKDTKISKTTVRKVYLHLKAKNISIISEHLFENKALAVLPSQTPAGTVSVHLTSAVLVAQYIVTHDRK